MVLANSYYYNDGFDSQGRPDISQAVFRAAEIADANGSGVVTVDARPNGGYSWRTAPTLAPIRPLRIFGAQMAGPITPDPSTLGNGALMTLQANPGAPGLISLEGLAFVGNAAGTDCGSLITTTSDMWSHFERCIFQGIQTSSHILNLGSAKVVITDCQFGGCSASGNDWIHILGGTWGIVVYNNLLGVPLTGVPFKSNSSDNVLHLLGDSIGSQEENCLIYSNQWQAQTNRWIWADPAGGLAIDTLIIYDNRFLSGPTLAIDVHDCSSVRLIQNTYASNAGGLGTIQTRCTGNVDSWVAEQERYMFGSGFTAADLTGVRTARISRSSGFGAGIGVTLRAGVGELYLEDNDGRVGTNLTVAAGSPRIIERFAGIVADYLTATGAISVNQLVQIAAAGQVKTAVAGSDVTTIYGVAQSAIANGALGPIARRRQRGLTLINDGVGAIAAGGRVQPSAGTAGDITAMVAAAQTVGIAESAFAGGAGSTGQASCE